ncbi:MAG: TrkA family potassium uptake protein [Propionibacteriaceae bacterium]|jgi:trk system potassium uptake protein TrkA|nr:TrkA family potassium uptake protein [Propionibacteriaceae bacterium]
MHYVIMGCGRVGSNLARGLEGHGHSVAVVDVNPDSFQRLGPQFQGATIEGVGFDRDILIQAGIRQAAGYAAVSSGDNSNIIGARLAREYFGVTTVVARIYDPSRAQVYERLGIPTVATVRWAAEQVLAKLVDLGPELCWHDPSGAVQLLTMSYHEGWVGRPIIEIEKQLHTPVPTLDRFGTGVIPDPSTVLQDQDTLYVMVDQSRVAQVRATLAAAPDM